MEAQQLDLFGFEKPKKKAKPKQKEQNEAKKSNKNVQPKRRLKKGEIAYQCVECDDQPTIYSKIIPLLKCKKCGFYVEVIDEKIIPEGEK